MFSLFKLFIELNVQCWLIMQAFLVNRTKDKPVSTIHINYPEQPPYTIGYNKNNVLLILVVTELP